MTRSAALWLTVILVVTLGRIAATWRVFNVTCDEPLHIAAGYDYLNHHTFLDKSDPPLANALFALPFRNAPEPGSQEWIPRGNAILADHGHYLRGTAKARAGNLLFAAIAIVALFFWARDLLGERIALMATAIFSLLPPVLAHGGLATTDMAVTAAFAVAMLAYDRWLANPSWMRTSALAGAIAFGALSKFSFPIVFLIGAVCLSVARKRMHIARAVAAIAIAFVLVWAAYFFTFGTIKSAEANASNWSREVFGNAGLVRKLPLPAPAFFAGLLQAVRDDKAGSATFLLGHFADRSWWWYLPIVAAVKTPIPLLLLAIAGAVLTDRRERHGELVAIALGILAVSMTSRISLGVRHILPMFVPLAMLAAYAASAAWSESRRWKIAVAITAVWLAADSITAHPDYLPWMNALAGRHPEHVLADSNFDWGQDLVRLRRECRRRHIDRLGILSNTTAASDSLGLPLLDPNPIQPNMPVKGWIAVGETPLQMAQAQDREAFTWLTANRPFVRVGKTIRLYRVD